jgi:outer membrane protein TolC
MPKRFLGFGLLLVAQSALAQPAPAPKPAPPAAPIAPAAGAPPTSATTAATPTPESTLPQITDDMLAPAPPAINVLQSWQDAIRLLRQNSSTLRSLQAQQEVARAQARQALSPALPVLTADAGITRHLLTGERTDVDFVGSLDATVASIRADPLMGQPVILTRTSTTPDPLTTWQAGLNLRVPLLDLSAWHEYGTAKARIDVTHLNSKAAERIAIAVAADAVVTTVTAERLAEVSRVSLESALSTLNLYKRRAELGAASAIDVLRIEQEVSLSRSQVVAANDGVLRAREALGAALGSSDPYGVTPNIRLDALVNDAKGSCKPAADVLQRADVRAAEASVSVARRSEEGVTRAYWPTVDAVSSLTYWSPESPVNGKHVTWSVGGVLSWTLYDGGLRYATKEVRAAETRVAGVQLSEAKRQARLEVTQALRAVKVSEATLAVAVRTREIAVETARLTKVAYLNGSGTTFDLVDTARRQREAELDFTIKEFEVLRAKIAALLALANCDV